MNKPKCMLTVDVEALSMRAKDNHVNTLIYGKVDGQEYGIGRMMDIADRHNVKMSFFVDFAECELYGDEILEVGRYVESRGHDLQVHCHYDLLKSVVGKEPWAKDGSNYYSWYTNREDTVKIIDYVTDRFVECTGRTPIAYRGGEYRFGIEVIKYLKEKGYKADLSYNYVRPQILPQNKQIVFENGLMEFPLGIMPNRKPINFNYQYLMPASRDEFAEKAEIYMNFFKDYCAYHGDDAVVSVLMHSWSFMHDADYFATTKLMDKPNDLMVEFYDYLLGFLSDYVDFVSVTEAFDSITVNNLKVCDFNSVFRVNSPYSEPRVKEIYEYVKRKAEGRRIIIWGKGWLESTINLNANINRNLDVEYYISNDADRIPTWREKPVHKSSDVSLSAETDYVFVVAQGQFSEIRDDLRKLGFKDYEDFFDIQKGIPKEITNGEKKTPGFICPICGGETFETYNSVGIRRCSSCGSVERSRTAVKLLKENIDFGSESKVLHVSPTKTERIMFRNMGVDTTTVDIRPECKTDIVADICDMPMVETESFDYVFANCVLNHVYDDDKALDEIRRVLKENGNAVIFVMESGSNSTTETADPTSWYGEETFKKYRVGTYRHYGERDFTEKLRKHFSNVCCYEKYDEVTDSSCKWYRCTK